MPDIINAPELHAFVERHLASAPASLGPYRTRLRSYLRRMTSDHESVREAAARPDDPAWAEAAFANTRVLHRFLPEAASDLNRGLGELFANLGLLANLAASPDRPLAGEAAAFLRGLSHCGSHMFFVNADAQWLLSRANKAALRTTRHSICRPIGEARTGLLAATRCQSHAEIAALGREARNCLPKDWEV